VKRVTEFVEKMREEAGIASRKAQKEMKR